MSSWRVLRQMVYARDGGRCQVCLQRVGRIWDLGHLQDRCRGGADELENLVLMCVRCNRSEKPLHGTRDEARVWLRGQQQRATTGREVTDDWRPFLTAMYGRAPDAVGAI